VRARGRQSCQVVYLVHSHVYPDQVERLVNRLLADNGDAHVVVHHDYARSNLDVSRFDATRVDVLRHTPAIEWGMFSQAQALLRSLQWIDEQLDYRWVMFISGQDYPLRSPHQIQRTLLESKYDAFIEQPRRVEFRFRDETGARDFWAARYFYTYYALPPLVRRLPPAAAKKLRNLEVRLRSSQPFVFVWFLPRGGRTMIGFRRRRHPFHDGLDCYGGSDSFTWSRKCVRIVLDFVARRPDVVAYYRRTIHPSESLFNTILMNAGGLELHFDNLRFDRFSGPGAGHPDILRLTDLQTLLASGRHFARKFDATVDAAILDALDESIDRERTADAAASAAALTEAED
jgi:hypothetical protein